MPHCCRNPRAIVASGIEPDRAEGRCGIRAGDYTASLQSLAALRVPVDAFFDSVMVNAEDAALRANRLALLAQLHGSMNRVADIPNGIMKLIILDATA